MAKLKRPGAVMSVMFIERWAISILLSRNLTTCTFSSSCCFAYTCIQLISSDLERGITREDVHNSPEAPQASPHPVNWRRSNHITFDSDSWSTTTSNTITKYTEPRPLRAKLESLYEREGASRSINSVDELLRALKVIERRPTRPSSLVRQ